MRRIRTLVVSSALVVTALAAVPAVSAASSCTGADTVPSATTHEAQATLCLLNQQRRAHGLRALRMDTKLGKAARGHAEDMVAKRYFDHDSKSGASFEARIKRTGWTKARRSYIVGENLAWGGGHLATPREIVKSWMNSPGHRSNILAREFRMIGIGIANGAPTGGAGATYATDFGG
jgi:uncharacterized protein YkwD